MASENITIGSGTYSISYNYYEPPSAWVGRLQTQNNNGITTTYTYYDNGDVKRSTDETGRWVEYGDYRYGLWRAMNKNDVYVKYRTIDWAGCVRSETDGNNYTTDYNYDKNWRLKEIRPPVESGDLLTQITYGYIDGHHKIVSQGASWMRYNYEEHGLLEYTLNSQGIEIRYDYDGNGRRVGVTHPHDGGQYHWTYYDYDALDRLKKVTHPDNSYVEHTYYQSEITRRNELSKITEYQYSCFGSPFENSRLVSVKDALDQDTYYEYNPANQCTLITADGQYSRRFHYNSSYLLEFEISPECGQTNYSYDNAGNLQSRTDANGRVTQYTYDNITRLWQVHHDGLLHTEYTYDDADNITQVTTPDNFIVCTYDPMNRTTNKTLNIDDQLLSLTCNYDNCGNIETITYPDNYSVDFTYDDENRVLTIPGIIDNDIQYHASGRPKYFKTSNNIETDIEFDLRQRIQKITASKNPFSRPFFEEGYSYDLVDNLLALTDYDHSSNNQSFTYDDIGRLKTFNGPWGSGTYNYTANYAIGRRWQEIINSNTSTYSYSRGTHRLASVSGADNMTFSYDNCGKTITLYIDQPSVDITKTFRYNLENRADSIYASYDSGPIQYYKELLAVYDGFGDRVRVKKNIPLPLGDSRTHDTYYYVTSPGGQILFEKRISSGAEYTSKYIYLNGRLLCKIYSDFSGVQKYFYHNDYLGNAKAVTNIAQSMVYSWLGYPFGKQYSCTGSEYNDFRFTGKKFDDHTGLYYFGARYYMPEIGRFITPDPTRYHEKNNPVTLNQYIYCTNNPLKYIDPSGHRRIKSNEVVILNDIMMGAEKQYYAILGEIRRNRQIGGTWSEDQAAKKMDPVSMDRLPTKHTFSDKWKIIQDYFANDDLAQNQDFILIHIIRDDDNNIVQRIEVNVAPSEREIVKIEHWALSNGRGGKIRYSGYNDKGRAVKELIERTIYSRSAYEAWKKQMKQYEGLNIEELE